MVIRVTRVYTNISQVLHIWQMIRFTLDCFDTLKCLHVLFCSSSLSVDRGKNQRPFIITDWTCANEKVSFNINVSQSTSYSVKRSIIHFLTNQNLWKLKKLMRNMIVAPNTKLMLTGAALLIAVVSCSVAITRYRPIIHTYMHFILLN